MSAVVLSGICAVIVYTALISSLWLRRSTFFDGSLGWFYWMWLAAMAFQFVGVCFFLPGNFSLLVALSLVAFLVAFILFVSCFFCRLHMLGLLIFPLAIVSTALAATLDGPQVFLSHMSTGIKIHVILSFIAYGLLFFVGILSFAIYFLRKDLKSSQDKSRVLHELVRQFPPLDALEAFLTHLMLCGVFFLTLGLASGWWYHTDLFAQHIVHKTVLSMLAWVLFVTLLAGSYFFGWRGTIVLRGASIGAGLLILAYFGSKWVLDFVVYPS